MAKELELYQTLLNEQFRTAQKAIMLLNTTIKMRRSLNEKALTNSIYDLIIEIKKHYELIDFFNFNNEFAKDIYNTQKLISPDGMLNTLEYRPLEGFIFAVAPFNFSSISIRSQSLK